MLGLGLALNLAAKTISSAIDALLSVLKDRATYYENRSASKSIIRSIDNAGVLDDATILLTPTAYSDARVHSVKTYTGDDYVVGGDFSDFSTDWNTNTATESGGVVTIPDGGYIFQNISFPNDGTLRIRVEGSGTVKYRLGVISPSDTFITKTLPFTAYEDLNSADVRMQLNNTSGSDITVTKISVVDVSSDFDFDRASSATRIKSDGLVQDMQSITDVDLVQNGDFEELGSDIITNGTFDTNSDWNTGTGWEIANGKLVGDGTMTASDVVTQSYDFIDGKTYKFTFEITESSQGTVFIREPFNGGAYATGEVGTHTVYGVAGANNEFRLRSDNNFIGKIDNVSVQQVDPNDRWTLGKDWSIEGGELIHTGSASYTFQGSLRAGDVYEAVVVVTEADATNFVMLYIGGFQDAMTSPGTYTFIVTAVSGDAINLRGSGDCRVDSISVKNITFAEEDVDLARINYDSNGENGHWLLEPTSTNLITYSEDFEDSSWSNASVGTTPTLEGGYTAPDGSNSAYKISNANQDSFWYSSSVIGADNSRTIWARTVSGTGTAQLTSHNSNTNNTFNLTETWQRFEVNGTTSGIGSTNFYAVDFRGSGTLTELLIWGAQAEALSYATSYIPTYGSTVTRAAETLTGSGNSTLINSTEGVLYAEIAALVDDSSAREITLSDGTANNRVELRYGAASDRIQLVVRSGGVVQSSLTNSTNNILNFNKVAVKWKANDFAIWINGVEQGSDTSGSTPIGLNELQFNEGDGSGGEFYGKFKAVAVFNRALTDQELTDLTS